MATVSIPSSPPKEPPLPISSSDPPFVATAHPPLSSKKPRSNLVSPSGHLSRLPHSSSSVTTLDHPVHGKDATFIPLHSSDPDPGLSMGHQPPPSSAYASDPAIFDLPLPSPAGTSSDLAFLQKSAVFIPSSGAAINLGLLPILTSAQSATISDLLPTLLLHIADPSISADPSAPPPQSIPVIPLLSSAIAPGAVPRASDLVA